MNLISFCTCPMRGMFPDTIVACIYRNFVFQWIKHCHTDEKHFKQILSGDPTYATRSQVKMVRIFTSSTFTGMIKIGNVRFKLYFYPTDTKFERNYLMEKVYPRMKEFCQELGYEFQVVDMRWGVREEAENDHKTTEICMKEIELCQQLSTGPNFVVIELQQLQYHVFHQNIFSDLSVPQIRLSPIPSFNRSWRIRNNHPRPERRRSSSCA